jgi:hypothetical protein
MAASYVQAPLDAADGCSVEGRSTELGTLDIERTLPFAPALLPDVLGRLWRATAASPLRWTLGDRGTAGIDLPFVSTNGTHGNLRRWNSNARLWSVAGSEPVVVVIGLQARSDHAVDLTLRLADGQRERADDRELARALVAELAEELLWHASRHEAAAAR